MRYRFWVLTFLHSFFVNFKFGANNSSNSKVNSFLRSLIWVNSFSSENFCNLRTNTLLPRRIVFLPYKLKLRHYTKRKQQISYLRNLEYGFQNLIFWCLTNNFRHHKNFPKIFSPKNIPKLWLKLLCDANVYCLAGCHLGFKTSNFELIYQNVDMKYHLRLSILF